MSKKISSGKNAIDKMMIGLDKVANAVGSTLGPCGRNVYLYYSDPIQTKITNDGVSVATRIVLKDLEEDAGSFVIRNVAGQQLDDCGDGTTTTAILTQSIIHEALKRPENAMEVRESLKQAGEKVLKILSKKSIPIKKEDIEKVALISAEDKQLATLIAEIINKLGDKAVINVEDSKTLETNYDIVDGYEAHVGFMSPHFINDKSNRAVYEDVRVLCTEKKISNLSDIAPLFEEFKKAQISQCVIVCEDIDDSMLGVFVRSKQMGTFNALVIRAVGPLLKDIAGMVGSKIVSDSTGITFQNIVLESLGMAKKVVCDANKTIFLGDGVASKKYADELEKQADGEPNQYTQKTMYQRVAKLKGGIAVLRIGSPTDGERGYLKDKAEDAVKATQAALEEGIVEGGGMTLWRIAQDLKAQTIGEKILKVAMIAPLRKIVENAGKDYTEVIMGMNKPVKVNNQKKTDEYIRVKGLLAKELGRTPLDEEVAAEMGLELDAFSFENLNKFIDIDEIGYDAKNNKYVDLVQEGIIDPAKVVRCALTNAISSASSFITIGTLISEEVEDKK